MGKLDLLSIIEDVLLLFYDSFTNYLYPRLLELDTAKEAYLFLA